MATGRWKVSLGMGEREHGMWAEEKADVSRRFYGAMQL